MVERELVVQRWKEVEEDKARKREEKRERRVVGMWARLVASAMMRAYVRRGDGGDGGEREEGEDGGEMGEGESERAAGKVGQMESVREGERSGGGGGEGDGGGMEDGGIAFEEI